jgi:hypothetical protein
VRQEAEELLQQLLVQSNGKPLLADAVLAAGQSIGVSKATMRRARRRVGLQVVRQGFGANGYWIWKRPATKRQPPEAVADHLARERELMRRIRALVREYVGEARRAGH